MREWLGGLKACGDFLQNLSFCPFVFLSCPAFVQLSCLASCLACFPALCLVFLALWIGFLSLSDYTQKERAQSGFASSLVLLWACLDVLKHYRYFLRFIVPMSSPFTYNSCDLFRMIRCVFSLLPVFIYHRPAPII